MATNPITWADVIAIAAELEDVPDPARAIILAHVNGSLNEAVFSNPGSFRLARIYLAAHVGTYSMPGGGGGESLGAVTSESVGGITRTYEAIAASSSDSNLDATGYGSTYRSILRMQPRARLPRVIF